MLEAIRTSWFSFSPRWRVVEADGRTVADVVMPWWSGRKMFLTIEGTAHLARWTKLFGRECVLEREGGLVVRAERPRFLDETLIVTEGERRYVMALKRNARGGKDFEVRQDERALGTLSCTSRWLQHRVCVDLAAEMSLESRVFVLALALSNWQSSDSA
jgi:hypothetical protein